MYIHIHPVPKNSGPPRAAPSQTSHSKLPRNFTIMQPTNQNRDGANIRTFRLKLTEPCWSKLDPKPSTLPGRKNAVYNINVIALSFFDYCCFAKACIGYPSLATVRAVAKGVVLGVQTPFGRKTIEKNIHKIMENVQFAYVFGTKECVPWAQSPPPGNFLATALATVGS